MPMNLFSFNLDPISSLALIEVSAEQHSDRVFKDQPGRLDTTLLTDFFPFQTGRLPLECTDDLDPYSSGIDGFVGLALSIIFR